VVDKPGAGNDVIDDTVGRITGFKPPHRDAERGLRRPVRPAAVDPRPRPLAPTRGDKIDYVLLDRGHFTNPSGGPQRSRFSDHDVLVGQATRS